MRNRRSDDELRAKLAELRSKIKNASPANIWSVAEYPSYMRALAWALGEREDL